MYTFRPIRLIERNGRWYLRFWNGTWERGDFEEVEVFSTMILKARIGTKVAIEIAKLADWGSQFDPDYETLYQVVVGTGSEAQIFIIDVTSGATPCYDGEHWYPVDPDGEIISGLKNIRFGEISWGKPLELPVSPEITCGECSDDGEIVWKSAELPIPTQ